MEKSRKPKIRFKGFTDDWEQRELGEVGKARSGIGFPDTEQGGTIGVPFFKVSDMNSDGNENEMTVANNYVTAEQIATYRWLPIEELPALFFAKVGAAVMLNRKRLCRFPFLLDNNTMAYSLSSTEWNADFAKALFETIDLTSLVQIGALPSYNAGDVEAMEISMPSLSEQGQIGEFFNQLDNLITLHQRKLDKLINVKKSMLEKMFPKQGSTVPEIRFNGFTQAWEQRKLGEVVEFLDTMRKPLEGTKRSKGPYPYYGASGIVDYVDGYLFDEELILLSEDGANIMDRNYPVCFLASGKYWVNNHAHVLKVKQGNENSFVCNSLERKDYSYYNTGMAMPKLNKETCRNIIVTCSSFEEQKIIGDCFRKLEKLITLHQRKLEKLENIKKSMLEKMFI